ncbi:MAG: ABC-type multidrug transport system, ATPase component [Gemmatimonadetes bacterium]|nr:ABC-type multidrug transport system, ATPase component [Gemmatimonadota bacterium]
MIDDQRRGTAPLCLTLDDLSVHLGERVVIRDCVQRFCAGAVHGVLGQNGAGKTTLFDAIFGLLAHSAGTITLDGRPLVAGDVAYLPSELRLYDGITGEELLLLFAMSGRISEAARQYAEALEVPLNALIETHSFGTRRKLALVAVSMLDRPVLLLDEPFEALDVVSRRVVRHILKAEAERGRIVIYSAHELEALPTFSDWISLLRDGRFIGEFPTQSIAELEALLTTDVDARLLAFRTR